MTKSPPKLFESLRTDPQKVEGGVWITHPETEDQFLVRRLGCAQHIRAYLQAAEDYRAAHGDEAMSTPEAERFIEAAGMAAGLVVGWKLAGDPDRTYDQAAMAAALRDPELEELRLWLRASTTHRDRFRPDHAAGN